MTFFEKAFKNSSFSLRFATEIPITGVASVTVYSTLLPASALFRRRGNSRRQLPRPDLCSCPQHRTFFHLHTKYLFILCLAEEKYVTKFTAASLPEVCNRLPCAHKDCESNMLAWCGTCWRGHDCRDRRIGGNKAGGGPDGPVCRLLASASGAPPWCSPVAGRTEHWP